MKNLRKGKLDLKSWLRYLWLNLYRRLKVIYSLYFQILRIIYFIKFLVIFPWRPVLPHCIWPKWKVGLYWFYGLFLFTLFRKFLKSVVRCFLSPGTFCPLLTPLWVLLGSNGGSTSKVLSRVPPLWLSLGSPEWTQVDSTP